MENKFKYMILGFLVIVGILGYIFKSNSMLYYLLISLLGGYLISTAVDHLLKEAKNKGKMNLLTWFGSAVLILSGIMVMVLDVTNIVFWNSGIFRIICLNDQLFLLYWHGRA
ncbi:MULTISPECIES: hypothetical protein [Methanobacterium]|jgi:hypothetical protein|uniref:Uncharacterized protein n=1 Tax=Methanobacterium veterum TaxID=408577 RepID=A0A9E5DHF1_9EURY|nr:MULTISPECIES: hypothetical protein [Methanobacterium]MCZ3365681.1 hypothetical protein [Methanobacterium veterum]MCZ3371145.1 hypothetical protein [Methanobacterium veterum]